MSASPSDASPPGDPGTAALQRRLERERAARKAAEGLLTEKARELYEALGEARGSQQRLRLALWASNDGIWEWQREDGRLLIKQFFDAGAEGKETLGTLGSLLQRVHAQDREALQNAWDAHEDGRSDVMEASFRTQEADAERWLRMRGRAVARDADGIATTVIGTIRDITAQRASEASLHLLGHAFAQNRDGLAIVDADWRMVACNPALSGLIGLACDDLRARDLRSLLAADDVPLVESAAANSRFETTIERSDGGSVPVDVSVSRFTDPSGGQPRFMLTLRDASERHRAAERLRRLAQFDTVTGLPNRNQFEWSLRDAVARMDRESGNGVAVLFLGLDGFKSVNDGLGHAGGDQLLREIAHRVRGWAREQDLVARWGGDTFALLVRDADPGSAATKLARRLLDVIVEPVEVGEHRLTLTGSIGIALAPEHGRDPELLLRLADAAMNAAKRAGRGRFMVHAGGATGSSLRDLEVLGALRTDLEQGQLRVHGQPKVDAEGRIVGYEMLMRWHHATLGQVSPAYFVPLAERHGLIARLGAAAIQQSIAFAAQLRARGSDVHVAINLSPYQLGDADNLALLCDACRKHGVSPRQIELEITESALLDNPEAAREAILGLKAKGFAIALDDFGTGYSALAYLRELPLDKVKIDRSFVMDVVSDARAAALLRGVVSLCHGLGMRTVAEGVETVGQQDFLVAQGVDELQGFLFHRPQPVQALLAALDAPT